MPNSSDPFEPTPPQVDVPAARPETPDGARPAGDFDVLPSGTGLGKYRILDRIRASETAVIYKARDILLDRLVVIKQLAPHLLDDPRACGRFRKEAYILAQMGSEVRYAAGIHEMIEIDRGLFIVSEFAPGFSLETLIAKQRLGLQATLVLLARLCVALRNLHAARITHRDLAPRHIIVESHERPRITDFSLAAAEGTDPDFTLTNPIYTAPEVILGQPFDDRVDLYSLGVIVYELLVGRPAFRNLLHETVGRIDDPVYWLAWHVRLEQEWPEAHVLNPRVPQVLASIVARLLAKSPDARFNDAEDVIALLVRHFARATVRQLPQARAELGGAVPPPAAAEHPPMVEAAPSAPAAGFQRSALQDAASATTTRTVSLRSRRAESPGYRAARPAVYGPRREERPAFVPLASAASLEELLDWNREARRRLRRKQRIRRAVITTVLTLAVGGGSVAMFLGYPLLWPDRAGQIEQLVINAREALDQSEFASAARMLQAAERLPVSGLRAYNAHGVALAWRAYAEARLAMQRGDLTTAESKLRDAGVRGLGTDLLNPIRKELIKQQSAQRLQEQNEGAVSQPADRTAPASAQPATTSEPTSKPLELSESTARLLQSLLQSTRNAIARKDYNEAEDIMIRAKAIQQTDDVLAMDNDVMRLKRFAREMSAGDRAAERGSHNEAVEHYREAVRLNGTAEVHHKLKRAAANALIAEGREAFERGDLDLAAQKFTNAAWRDDTSDGRAELARIEPQLKAMETVREADAAAETGDWLKACQLYLSVYDQLPAPVQARLDTKITACKRRFPGLQTPATRDSKG